MRFPLRRAALFVILLCGLIGWAPAARAGELYAGAAVGEATFEVDFLDSDFDSDDRGYEFFVGKRFLRFAAVELGYTDLGDFEETPSFGTLDANAEMFQTDAAINEGNSGGPVFNMSGEVIGVVSHMITQSGGHEGLGFAMTSNMARELLLDNRSIWSGFEGFFLTGELARALNLPQDAGILVQRVADGSPAASMGLRPGTVEVEIGGQPVLLGGDVILEVQSIRISDEDAQVRMRALMNTLVPGEQIAVNVLRGGKRVELSTVLVKR